MRALFTRFERVAIVIVASTTRSAFFSRAQSAELRLQLRRAGSYLTRVFFVAGKIGNESAESEEAGIYG